MRCVLCFDVAEYVIGRWAEGARQRVAGLRDEVEFWGSRVWRKRGSRGQVRLMKRVREPVPPEATPEVLVTIPGLSSLCYLYSLVVFYWKSDKCLGELVVLIVAV